MKTNIEEVIIDFVNETVRTFVTDKEANEWLYKDMKNYHIMFYYFEKYKDIEALYNSDDMIIKKKNFLKPLTRNVTLMKYKTNPFFTLSDSVREVYIIYIYIFFYCMKTKKFFFLI